MNLKREYSIYPNSKKHPDSNDNGSNKAPLVIPKSKLNPHILDVRNQWRGLIANNMDSILSIFLIILKKAE